MKVQLDTLDIICLISELKEKLLGARVDQVYDIDRKNYLIRLVKNSVKSVLFIESGTRFHTTRMEWPKNPAPSGFTMKLRKHISNKRLENIEQVGSLRIVKLTFGSNEAAYHLIVELYDKGNIILTDYQFNILNVIRVHQQGEERIAAHEKYDLSSIKSNYSITLEELKEKLSSNKGKPLRQALLSSLEFGPALLSHVLKGEGFTLQSKIPQDFGEEFEGKIFKALEVGRILLEEKGLKPGGFIVKGKSSEFYEEFHPSHIIENYDETRLDQFPTLDESIDEFFSKIEAQKIEKKQLNQEKEALKKLEHVKLDIQKRIEELKITQELDKRKAELIMFNQPLVDHSIGVLRKMVASQLSWDEIWERIQEAAQIDQVAQRIKKIDLLKNQFSIELTMFDEEQEEVSGEIVDINLGKSAYSNATQYFDLKRASAKKEERTVESQEKAYKNTEKKTLQTLKEVATIQNIKKARKVLWFEKFRFFISSENYLVIGGRDAQQNELLVKKYLHDRDVYLHSDSHGSPSVIIKSDQGGVIPPKTLNEAGTFAICCSSSWDTKVISTCWWVFGNQVSKSAPTGEYLPTGSFMIRGKKNFLPPLQLVLGFGFLFRLSEESMPQHKGERSIKNVNENEEIAKDQIQTRESSSKEDSKEISTPEPEISNETTIVNTLVLPSLNITKESVKSQQQKQQKNAQQHGSAKSNSKSTSNVPTKEVVKKDEENPSEKNPNPNNSNVKKRGQHGKKKKMNKYKDQDDEERIQRLQLLNPALAKEHEQKEEEKRLKALKEQEEEESPVPEVKEEEEEKPKFQKPFPPRRPKEEREEPVEEDVETEQETLNILDTLTGCPLENDELLFALPMVAPWNTLQNYKFKIKMIPGQAKRGKAAKTALESFIRDKGATQRERDLLKSIKDQDLARNFPGKVKLGQMSKK